MEINNNYKLTVGVLAVVIASMMFVANGGIKPTFAQIAGITPLPSTDQGTSNNATSGTTSNMNMSTSGMTNQTTVTRDTVTLLLEGKSIPGMGFLHLYDSAIYDG
jgi:hypothetical protein